jgi:phosphohistidine phosphatase
MEAEDDFERGLTDRGRKDATRAAESLHQAGYRAEVALVSPSLRTMQTWNVVSQIHGELPIINPMALYHASMDMLERAVTEQLSQGSQSIIIVGHNPGIGGLAHAYAAKLGVMNKIPPGWPTSALGVFDIELDNGEIVPTAMHHTSDPKA